MRYVCNTYHAIQAFDLGHLDLHKGTPSHDLEKPPSEESLTILQRDQTQIQNKHHQQEIRPNLNIKTNPSI